LREFPKIKTYDLLVMVTNDGYSSKQVEPEMEGAMKPLGVLAGTMVVVALLLDSGVDAQNAAPAAGVSVHNRSAVQETGVIDFANARAMPLPTANLYEADRFADRGSPTGTPGFVRGARGDGGQTPTFVPLQRAEPGDDFTSDEYGTSNHVFTTSRVDLAGTGTAVSNRYPYRAAGKLYFNIGAGTYVCSASLIKRGVIVTAAHCVTDFGGAWYSNWRFVPALAGTSAPYGTWSWAQVVVLTSYKNGTDSCAVSGVVCRNDIAVIRLAPRSGAYPGTSTGWLGYGWNGYGFNTVNLALINQLGYPVSHDSGNRMQRTDSEGFVGSAVSYSGNTIWGSRQTGGSSGGPEVVNLGAAAALSGISYGAEPNFNIVVGVTSWGYTNQAVKQQGASPFTSTNIVPLVNTVCNAVPAACS
jgi:V8-like Glu-specific endopeptidase